MKKLPNSEFDVMRTIWANIPPVTTKILMEQLGNEKGWKTPALITLLNRLIKRGFLRSEKNGKERTYFPLITKEDYIKFETKYFLKKFHQNSFTSLIAAMLDCKEPTANDIEELKKWISERGE